MNHKWQNDKCERCGISRVMKSWSKLMFICNHPPWQGYYCGKSYYYSGNGIKGTYNRPDCKKVVENVLQLPEGRDFNHKINLER